MSPPFTTPTAARDLREGDYVDLEGDPYADVPTDDCDDALGSPFQYEYSVVMSMDIDADGWVTIDFDDIVAGFPPNHLLPVNTELSEIARGQA